MVGAGRISHNPNLAGEVGGSWTKLGENVGVGYDVGSLMQAFIDSPSHHENLVDPGWNFVGVGVQLGRDGRIFTTHNFMQLPEVTVAPPPPSVPSAPPPPPAPAPPATAAPATTAPPRGSAPATSAPAPAAATAATTTTVTAAPAATRAVPRSATTPARIAAVLTPLRSIDT